MDLISYWYPMIWTSPNVSHWNPSLWDKSGSLYHSHLRPLEGFSLIFVYIQFPYLKIWGMSVYYYTLRIYISNLQSHWPFKSECPSSCIHLTFIHLLSNNHFCLMMKVCFATRTNWIFQVCSFSLPLLSFWIDW